MASPLLPDPTSDLHWSDYRGAIHEIFAENAGKIPDNPCVVETASSSTPERVFTYKQMNEASNVLAHHLIDNGVQRGEVVMVYAYRGVDLVVACFGILKAGATFSVVDPQYPPDRQVIYLDVSQPRALITIHKAIKDSGELSNVVRSYVDNNLKLRTEVPYLELLNDGTLIGGKRDGEDEDCLAPQVARKSENASIPVGPDSTPTLSFTSGSEGRPKGVKGRHFSLAYYFPWMSEVFHLSAADKFTMLSGIAHDPIQRDMFTPLFLGAQLVVPPPEDITFDRLSSWAAKNEVTVCHLTPAMGQILLGNPTGPKIESLHHVFFVGDLLLKRDCRKLQELAPGLRIINMYGTTETSRAVSYYEIPSRKEDPGYLSKMGDVIPAGKGMYNVQLIVVDRENKNRVCGMGEIGEIYVRAGGLAEGYLGDDLKELTDAKFVQNWFVAPDKWREQDLQRAKTNGASESWRDFYKGPRDRLYRSGDLGRYTPSGDVECTGRADDQIKIRGFRIELGEIDTYLAEHSLVSQNVTLVKRDHKEEQILVSYIVPDLHEWQGWAETNGDAEKPSDPKDESMAGLLRRFRSLSQDVRDHLKKKLPHYAIPDLFIPMLRLPLTPNGKVDKRALPFPEKADLLAAAPRGSNDVLAQTDTEKALAEIWSKYLPGVISATVPADVPFFDLGGNSISAQQMLSDVSKKWESVNLPLSIIYRSRTLKAFAGEIDRSLDPVGLRLDAQVNGVSEQGEHYSNSVKQLQEAIPKSFEPSRIDSMKSKTVLLTGGTGFLGAFILRDLLGRSSISTVICLVRADNPEKGLGRVMRTCEAYGIWQDSWKSRIECITGNLEEQPTLGVNETTWKHLAERVDLIIHNGARVHWVLPYSNLKAANVMSTVSLLQLCALGKPKQMGFVSSTSVLDTDHYTELSDKSIGSGGKGISEADDLEGSKQDLGTGYGQSKWVSESLMRESGRRGLTGTIIRPGYVLGDPKLGTTITDDFVVRLLKGCVQVRSRPDITNTINMVPVDHVAHVVAASSLRPLLTAQKSSSEASVAVCQVTAHPRLTFNAYLHALETYGYTAPLISYREWKRTIEVYVAQTQGASDLEPHALLGLYHMVTDDMPAATKAPELDDANTISVLKEDARMTGERDLSQGAAVTEDTVGVYLAYLVKVGFMPPPPEDSTGKKLPQVIVSKEQLEALKGLGGRGS